MALLRTTESTPSAYSGGWQRRWRRLGPIADPERAHVVRLQAAGHFVDVRQAVLNGPAVTPAATAGTTSVQASQLVRHRTIDGREAPSAEATDADDTTRVRWSGYDDLTEGRLVTTGSGEVLYEEGWHRLPDAQLQPACALAPSDGVGLAVRCGDHLAALHRPDPDDTGRWAAVHLRRRAGSWSAVVRLGNHTIAAGLEAEVVSAVEQRSDSWRVLED